MQTKMVRTIVAFVAFFVACSNATWATRIPEDVKKVVVFVFVLKDGQLVPNGTGFFAGVPLEQNSERLQVYLVTARHVIEDEIGNRYARIWVRLNKKAGGTEIAPLDLAGTEKRVLLTPMKQSTLQS